ncbi:hypothetical protein [Paenisporosarcina sp. TG20]|uniref:hypothetical protein n=1 Tax=Paenisporosarcina sp. TG20 TaxID=1211706 RepID=UPI0002EBA58C|nr:hypothetical protein [Paenisporosarcina sp. TG20]
MSIHIGIVVSIILMAGITLITYYFGNKGSIRLIKYIPAIATATGVLFFYIKLNFIPNQTHAYEEIFDMLAIILLANLCGISLLAAIIMEVVNKRKQHKKR